MMLNDLIVPPDYCDGWDEEGNFIFSCVTCYTADDADDIPYVARVTLQSNYD